MVEDGGAVCLGVSDSAVARLVMVIEEGSEVVKPSALESTSMWHVPFSRWYFRPFGFKYDYTYKR